MVQRDSGVADLFGVVTVLHRGVLGIDKNGLDIETNNKLNMEKEQDFFSKLVESFPKEYAGLVIVAAVGTPSRIPDTDAELARG